jgi:hypothetical protein
MAKTSMIEREKRRAQLAKRYGAKRAKLRETISSPKSTDDEREEAVRKLQAMPRDWAASAARSRAAPAASIGSSASAVPSCARRRCAATSPACARPAGKAA